MRVFDGVNDDTVFRLNQVTVGSQAEVKVTTLADGSFLVLRAGVEKAFAREPASASGSDR